MFFDGNPRFETAGLGGSSRNNNRRGAGRSGRAPSRRGPGGAAAKKIGQHMNLSGNSRTLTKEEILQQSQIQRQERYQRQLETQQSKVLQKYIRGFLVRTRFLRQFLSLSLQTEPQSQQEQPPVVVDKAVTTTEQPQTIADSTRRLNVLLRLILSFPLPPHLLRQWQQQQQRQNTTKNRCDDDNNNKNILIRQLLLQYHAELISSSSERQNNSNNHNNNHNCPPYANYIWQQTLQQLQQQQTPSSTAFPPHAAQRILEYCLPQPTTATTTTSATSLLGTHGMVLLCQTCLQDHDPDHHPNHKHDNNDSNDHAAAASSSLISFLWQYIASVLPHHSDHSSSSSSSSGAQAVWGILEWLVDMDDDDNLVPKNHDNDSSTSTKTTKSKDPATLWALMQALVGGDGGAEAGDAATTSRDSDQPQPQTQLPQPPTGSSSSNNDTNKKDAVNWKQVAVQLLMPTTTTTKSTTTTSRGDLTSSSSLRLLRLLHLVLKQQQPQNHTHHHSSSSSVLVVPLLWKILWHQYPSLVYATIVASGMTTTTTFERRRQELQILLFGKDPTDAGDETAMMMEMDDMDSQQDNKRGDERASRSSERVTIATTATTTTTSTTTNSYTKQELATAPKLEKLQAQTREQWMTQQRQLLLQQNRYTHNHNDHDKSRMRQFQFLVTDLALQLAQVSLWLQWGHELLSSSSLSSSQTNAAARRDYILALTVLLQGQNTGLHNRTSASSPFLTQLAFAQQQQHSSSSSTSFLVQLWQYIQTLQEQESSSKSNLVNQQQQQQQQQIHLHCAWSIFADIFAQQLIAVRDEQFLQRHTNNDSHTIWNTRYNRPVNETGNDLDLDPTNHDANGKSNNSNNKILAELVVDQLKQHLYQLYWSQPVVTHETETLLFPSSSPQPEQQQDDSAAAAARIRLFLTGTKVWNSLYARWCRLVRHTPFCPESTWFFPNHDSFLTLGATATSNATTAAAVAGDGAQRPMDGVIRRPHDMDVDDDDEDDDDDDDPMDMDYGPSSSHANRDASRNHHHLLSPQQQQQHRQRQAEEDAEAEALADIFKDAKVARILVSIPQVLSFERRVRLFHTLLQVDKAQTQDESYDMQATVMALMRGEENIEQTAHRVNVEIRRDALYQDSMRQLNQLGSNLKKKVKVSFINQHGTQEAGIDGGGVFKEFLDDLIKEAFTPPPPSSTSALDSAAAAAAASSSSRLQLFAVTPTLETLMVNPAYANDPQYLPHYEFLGRAVGKAVYESLLVEPQFCLPFLNTLLGKSNTLEDLKNLDPTYYHSLVQMMTMSRNDLQQTGLTFEVNLPGQAIPVELIPNGANVPVTKENVIQYAHLVSHRLLNVQSAKPIQAFLQGFRDLIPPAWIRLFSAAHELQKLISGNDEDDSATTSTGKKSSGFNVPALKTHMAYTAGYHPSQPIMIMFWEIIEEMTREQQRKFLKFMTSCSRQPLLGFASLDPPPCIQQVRLPEALFVDLIHGEDLSPAAREQAMKEIEKQAPLPTASTCMNLLKLPNYPDKELMRKKLLAAIEAGAGFELS